MDTIEAIFTRRTVRQFSGEPVCEKDLQTLLKAGFQAPSAGNAQPTHFIVMRERSILDQIPSFHSSSAFMTTAPLGILIVADERVSKPGRWVQDASAAAMSVLLAAHALGLGACWVGIEPVPDRIAGFVQLAGLPENIHPVCLIAVGHPLKTPPPEERVNPERIHLERW